jgi:hypothetical protein
MEKKSIDLCLKIICVCILVSVVFFVFLKINNNLENEEKMIQVKKDINETIVIHKDIIEKNKKELEESYEYENEEISINDYETIVLFNKQITNQIKKNKEFVTIDMFSNYKYINYIKLEYYANPIGERDIAGYIYELKKEDAIELKKTYLDFLIDKKITKKEYSLIKVKLHEYVNKYCEIKNKKKINDLILNIK